MFREKISGHCSMGWFPIFRCFCEFLLHFPCTFCFFKHGVLGASIIGEDANWGHLVAIRFLLAVTVTTKPRWDFVCACRERAALWIISAFSGGLYGWLMWNFCRVLWAIRKIDTSSFALMLSKYSSLSYILHLMVVNSICFSTYHDWLSVLCYDIRLSVLYAILNNRFVYHTIVYVLWLWSSFWLL